jgi:hypothetical protein
MSNLKLYITPADYQQHAGSDWPSYEDVVAGVKSSDTKIQSEIDQLVDRSLKAGVKFPLNTATACQNKWTWSTIFLNTKSTSSCHRVNPVPFTADNFDNFHNLPKKLDDRRLMLEGKWPQGGCEYCKKIEEAGGHSDRHHNLDIRGLTPPELETDPTAIDVTPRIVEVFAENTCNFSCVYCGPTLSSQIEQENIKFGAFDHKGVRIPVVQAQTTDDVYFEKFNEWLENNVQHLVRLHLLGGETYLQHRLLDSVLTILERRPNPKLQLNIFSNFNVPDRLWTKYNSRVRDLVTAGNIQYFDLTASIDCWGTEAEYVRQGLDLDKFEEKFAWATEQSWLRLNVNQCVTAMTIRSMPALIEKIKQYSQHRHIGHYFEFTITDHFQHPEIFAYNTWDNDFDCILKAMPRDTQHQLEAIPRMIGLQKQLQRVTEHNQREIEQFKIYFDELDRRRNTNWREIFPYLDV